MQNLFVRCLPVNNSLVVFLPEFRVQRSKNVKHVAFLSLEINPGAKALRFAEEFTFRCRFEVLDLFKLCNGACTLSLINCKVAHQISMKFADKFSLSLAVLTESEQAVFYKNTFQVSYDFA